MTSKTVYQEVKVVIDLDDFDDDEIREEAEDRDLFPEEPDYVEQIVEMFYAFKLGKDQHAIELARKIAQDHMGMIL